MKKTLTDIDGALAAQRAADAPFKPRPDKNVDATFGIHQKQGGQLSMGNKVVQFDGNKNTLTVDNRKHTSAPRIRALRTPKHSRPGQWNSDDHKVYKSVIAQTKVKLFPNRTGGHTLHGNGSTCSRKWLYLEKG